MHHSQDCVGKTLSSSAAAAVAVHAHETVGEDAAAEEAPKLTLDEAGNGAFAGLRAGEEGFEFRLDHTVEDALLGAASRVAVLRATSAGVMPMGNRKASKAGPAQNSADPGTRGNGITSRMFAIPVMNCTTRSKPRPKPACGTEPYRRRSVYHQ